MDTSKILGLIKNLKNIDYLTLEKIPEIDLYMDQVTTFMEEKLSPYNRDNTQKVLTKTMINNYAKNKVILPPEKKKYSKEHLISLILIYHLKSILSINDISHILNSIKNNQNEVYSYFINLQKYQMENIELEIIDLIKYINNECKNKELDLIYLILTLLSEANTKKLLAEKLIDNFIKDIEN